MVFEAQNKLDGKPLVLKVQFFSEFEMDQKLLYFQEEIAIYKKVQKVAGLYSLAIFRNYYISLGDDKKIGALELEKASKSLADLILEKKNDKPEIY